MLRRFGKQIRFKSTSKAYMNELRQQRNEKAEQNVVQPAYLEHMHEAHALCIGRVFQSVIDNSLHFIEERMKVAGKPLITVIGVGGAGGNAVNNMISSQLEGVEFVVANTDSQALSRSLATRKVVLGGLTKGLGAGSKPKLGRASAESNLEEIYNSIVGSNMLFITGCLGGGTCTGAAPVISRLAKELGILTVAVVGTPFRSEGPNRTRLAHEGIRELSEYVDTLIVVPNQNLLKLSTKETTMLDAFRHADEVLLGGVQGVTDLIVKPGLINLDFADIKTILSNAGRAMMGSGNKKFFFNQRIYRC